MSEPNGKSKEVYNREYFQRVFTKHPELHQIIEGAYDANNFILVSLPFLDFMSHTECVFFSYLNFHAKKTRWEEEGLGWFYCYMQKICDELRISNQTHSRIMKKFINDGIIKVKWEQGRCPARRLMFICWDVIAEKLMEFSEKRQMIKEKHGKPKKKETREEMFKRWDES